MIKRLLLSAIVALWASACLAAGPIWVDRVQDTSTTTGTSDFVLSGTAPTGLQAWSTVGNGNTADYLATDTAGDWEVGTGTYSSTGPTLARTTVLASSNSGSKVSFPSGTKTISLVTPAAWFTGPLPLKNGGTSADLSGTGGASNVLKQVSAGAGVTVGQLACADLSNAGTGCSGVAGGLILGTDTATTSGSTVSVATGLPSTIKQVTLTWRDGATNTAAAGVSFQLGDATTGGFVTTGYTGESVQVPVGASPTTVTTALSDRGIMKTAVGTASSKWYSACTITLVNSSSHIYDFSCQTIQTTTQGAVFTVGYVTLAGALDRVQLLTTTSTFTGGNVNIAYQ